MLELCPRVRLILDQSLMSIDSQSQSDFEREATIASIQS